MAFIFSWRSCTVRFITRSLTTAGLNSVVFEVEYKNLHTVSFYFTVMQRIALVKFLISTSFLFLFSFFFFFPASYCGTYYIYVISVHSHIALACFDLGRLNILYQSCV